MRFLILNADYPVFLDWLYAQHPRLDKCSCAEQLRIRNESLFGVADFYSSNICKLGHEAYDVHFNNKFIQEAWAIEHNVPFKKSGTFSRFSKKAQISKMLRIVAQTPLKYLKPLARKIINFGADQPPWVYDILAAQIKYYKPDVIVNEAMAEIDPIFFKEIKSNLRLLVGEHAATQLPIARKFECYDLVFSSFVPTLNYFNRNGISAELRRLGFEPKILERLNNKDEMFNVTFVGSISNAHKKRLEWLEFLCSKIDRLKIWGPGIENLPSRSPIKKHYVGQAWGMQMYQILNRSKITLNHHGVIEPYANNMRLYEATGIGTMLITDWKKNLHEMFEIGKEIVVYKNPEECSELIEYYLSHDKERETIAKAGQQRTLRDHTYYQRMQELVDIIGKCI